MTDADAKRILRWIDSALELFRNNQGHLTGREVRILSLLTVAQQELAETLAEGAEAASADHRQV